MFCQIFKESLWWCTEANTETMSKYLWTYSNCICTIYKFHYTLLCILNLIRPPFHVLLVLSLLLHHLPLIIVIVFGVIIVGASCIWWPAFLLWSDVLVASYLQSPVFFSVSFCFYFCQDPLLWTSRGESFFSPITSFSYVRDSRTEITKYTF